ncbi:MAG: 50S ribosomal protein L30 [Legionellaceae bacterium]|nr:50S ribosomal protein L30 [Legionellaceae bacterium]
MEKKIKITLMKSTIGRKPKHILIVKQLGLRRIRHSIVHSDNPAIRGLIQKIDYLVCVEEIA